MKLLFLWPSAQPGFKTPAGLSIFLNRKEIGVSAEHTKESLRTLRYAS